MALEVVIVSGSGQEHAGCLLLTGEVLFVVSLSEDTQQQAFPVTEVACRQEPQSPGGHEPCSPGGQLIVTLQQARITSDAEVSGGGGGRTWVDEAEEGSEGVGGREREDLEG